MPSYENSEPHREWHQIQKPSHWSKLPPKPYFPEDTLKSGHVDIERKTFVFHLKENSRGRLLRITEENTGKRASIIIPATGLREFAKLLDSMLVELPPATK